MGKTYILGVNIYMKSMFINMALFSAFLFAANSCQRSPVIVNPPVTKPVNVDKVGKNVNSATNLNIVAKKGVSDAQIELKKAKKDAQEAKNLVAKMRSQNSAFAEEAERMVANYEYHIDMLTTQLQKTGEVLDEQLAELRKAGEEINRLRDDIVRSEAEKMILRRNTEVLAKSLKDEQKNAEKLKEWKDKNMWYKKWFWWSVFGAVMVGLFLIFGVVAYVYFAAPSVASGVASKWLRRF